MQLLNYCRYYHAKQELGYQQWSVFLPYTKGGVSEKIYHGTCTKSNTTTDMENFGYRDYIYFGWLIAEVLSVTDCSNLTIIK